MFSPQVRDNSYHVQDIKFRVQSKDKTNVKYTWIVKPWAGFLPERRDGKQKQNGCFCFLKPNKTQKAPIWQGSRTREPLGKMTAPYTRQVLFMQKVRWRHSHWLVQTRLWVKTTTWGFPGSPVVRTPHFHFRVPPLVRELGYRAAAKAWPAHTHTQNESQWACGWTPCNSTHPASSKLSRGFSESVSCSVMFNSLQTHRL